MDQEVEGRQLSISVQNPLLFDHIVEHIISFVGVEFLPSVRLVNRQWEKFALPKLLQNLHKFPVVLPGQGNISGVDSKMSSYLIYIAKEPRLIFSNFTLENLRFSAPLVDKFMSTVATEITELKLQFNEYQTPTIKWIGALVNLKTLTLELDSTSTPAAYHIDFIGSTRTLNLKRLCFNYTGSNPLAYFHLFAVLASCESLDVLSLSGMSWRDLRDYYFPRVPPNCPNPLVEISVEEMDPARLGDLMRQQLRDLKLKALNCQRLVLWDGEGRRFSAILERHKNTLESVMVGEVKDGGLYEWYPGYQFIFPDVMPKLKVFKMGLYGPTYQTGRIRTIEFSPVNFPVQLPSLEKLILYDGSTDKFRTQYEDEWEYLSRFFEGSDPHPKLTELCLPFVSSKLRNSVGVVFPEIRSLKMELGLDQNLQKIWEMWPQLKSLNLTLNGDRKKITAAQMKEFVAAGVRKNEETQESFEDINSDSGLISIANLKDLKYFKLRMIGDCKGSLIDFNVTRALCKLPCLEFLLFNQHNITKRGTREFLKYHSLLKKVVCPVHPEVYKIQRKYLPNNFIPSDFSTEGSVAGCCCSF